MTKAHIYIIVFLFVLFLIGYKWTKIAAWLLPKSGYGLVSRDFRASDAFANHRGIRNNNPGNLKQSNPRQGWIGAVRNPSDATFEQFELYVYGVRAMVKLIRNKVQNGLNTPEKLIGDPQQGWAPAQVDNNSTEAYIDFVADEAGMQPDSLIDASDKQLLWRISSAVEQFENGVKVMTYQEFENAWRLL
ncbi:MAG: hypothetical protein AAFP77_29395 [Bacteroidota bacterium]